mmetsp:Transcript_40930/g.66380  ORF Transcript_40930/g.66380 Transcript_40930/m.66380 type:complete len:85 (-) Transcript_40930:1693-1947(-)
MTETARPAEAVEQEAVESFGRVQIMSGHTISLKSLNEAVQVQTHLRRMTNSLISIIGVDVDKGEDGGVIQGGEVDTWQEEVEVP